MIAASFGVAEKGMTKLPNYQVSQIVGNGVERIAPGAVLSVMSLHSEFGKFSNFVIWSNSPAHQEAF
jgi:hypothetical protein